MDATQDRSEGPFRILCLDGGGAKGFYTVGVLAEIEALLGGRPLCERFDLVYGTSTGAIIAALISLGRDVSSIHDIYKKHVAGVMGKRTAHAKSAALKELAEVVFESATFDDVRVPIGLVATRWDFERPMILMRPGTLLSRSRTRPEP